MHHKLEKLAAELAQVSTERQRLGILWSAYRLFLRREITHDDYLDFAKDDR